MTSPAAVARIAREAVRRDAPGARLGVVVSTVGSAVSVRFEDGATTSSLSLAQGLAVTPGDRVVAVPARGGEWVVLARVAAQAVTAQAEERRAFASQMWAVSRTVNWADPTSWTRIPMAPDPVTGEPGGWAQGRMALAEGAVGEVTPQRLVEYGSFGYYGPLAALVPSGSTVTGVSLVLERYTTGAAMPALASPVVYGHAYTPTSPPPAARPSLTWGPYRYPPVQIGETTRLLLPATLVTAWLAGTVTGVALWSDQPADAMVTRPRPPGDLLIQYVPPPET